MLGWVMLENMNNSLHQIVSLPLGMIEKQKNHYTGKNVKKFEDRDYPEPETSTETIYCSLLQTNISICTFISCTFYKMCLNKA